MTHSSQHYNYSMFLLCMSCLSAYLSSISVYNCLSNCIKLNVFTLLYEYSNLFVCMSDCLSVCLCVPICLSVSFHVSVQLFVHFINLHIYFYARVCWSCYLYVCLPV